MRPTFKTSNKLTALFKELQDSAYDSIYHKYFYKECNQKIRKHFELLEDYSLYLESVLDGMVDVDLEFIRKKFKQ